jgi:hypothetical protein
LFEFLFGARAQQPQARSYGNRRFIGPAARDDGRYSRR